MTTEEKRLVESYCEQAFSGSMIRQVYPVCECGKIFTLKDLYEAPGVYFRNVDVFGKTFTLIEPICPVCSRKIPATFNVLN